MTKYAEEVVVNNSYGLHARPAAIFVRMANKFNSRVILEKGGEAVDGKSIIAILSLGINKGMMVKISVEGVDEHQALEELKNFLESDNG